MLTRAPSRIAVLCSGRAPGLSYLLGRGGACAARWQIVCCVSSEEVFEGEDEAAGHAIPVRHHPIRRFYASRAPGARLGDRAARTIYDAETARLLDEYRPDIVLLAGYLWVLTAPFLARFNDRVVNVHHADLRLRTPAGLPRYPGLRAVRDAILAGEVETRCTAHLATATLDAGPILACSEPFPVPPVVAWARANGEAEVLRRAIRVHEEWMLRAAFGPLMERAIDALGARERAA
jgi:folate-dependent phosphoribosylglycinamide formyltransferase PurN